MEQLAALIGSLIALFIGLCLVVTFCQKGLANAFRRKPKIATILLIIPILWPALFIWSLCEFCVSFNKEVIVEFKDQNKSEGNV